MTAKIVPFKRRRPVDLDPPTAEATIRRLAAAGKFAMFDEAGFTLKMLAGGFDMTLVMEALTAGGINQGPTLDEFSEWRCRMKKRVAGKLVRVVVAIWADLDFMTLISVH